MASREPIVISSSPNAYYYRPGTYPRLDETPTLSSVAAFHSISKFQSSAKLEARPAPRGHQIPEGSSLGFRSTCTIANEIGLELSASLIVARSDQEEVDNATVSGVVVYADDKGPPKKRKYTKRVDGPRLKLDKKPTTRQPRTKKKETQGDNKTPGNDGVAELVNSKTVELSNDQEKAKKVRKPRKSKDGIESQSQIRKGKVTKPGLPALALEVQMFKFQHGYKIPEMVRERADREVSITPVVDAASAVNTVDTVVTNLSSDPDLAATIRRRVALTPPRDTIPGLPAENPIMDEAAGDHDGGQDIASPPMLKALLDLRGHFGYNEQTVRPNVAGVPRNDEGEPFAKRRRIEIVDASNPNTTSVPVVKKVKAPAKSSRTITKIALENRHPPEKTCAPAEDTTPLFFAPRIVVTKQDNGNQTSIAAAKKSKKGDADTMGMPKAKRKPSTKSKKMKPEEVIPELLSPQTALRRLERQDILYGTSSQLVREDSPSYVRNLQQVLRESAETDDSSFVSTLKRITNSTLKESGRSLWAVGARDYEESLVLPERFPPTRAPPMKEMPDPLSESSFVNIDSVLVVVDAHKPRIGISPIGDVTTDSIVTAESHDKSSSTSALQMPSRSTKCGPVLQCLGGPLNVGMTTNRVLKPLDTNTKLDPLSKSTAKRTDMHPPPEQTKTAPKQRKQQTKEQNGETDIPASKKPRGRPQKTDACAPESAAVPSLQQTPPRKRALKASIPPLSISKSKASPGWTNIDDIEDPEPNITPSPPRRRSPLPPSALQISQPNFTTRDADGGEEEDKSEVAIKDRAILFAQIAKAIKAAPRSGNALQPTWREKMLLYDPIVVEDLAAWLNEGALRDLGGREAESIECEQVEDGAKMAKGKGKGAKKSRYEVKLEMVQKWCEENSVCCLRREGLRGGVKAHY